MDNKNFFVEVRIDNGSLIDPPHAFIVLTDEFGNKQGYGFAPFNNLDLWGPGEIGDDTKHPYNHSLPYEITQQQYEDLLSYIYQRQKDPGIYEGWDRNCVKFVGDALRYAGIDDLQSAPLTHPVELWWRQSFIAHYSNGTLDLANLGDYDQLGNFITSLQTNFYQAEVTRSPLILDLDGDGVETLSKSAGIHFDQDGNHFAETTGWVGKDDGLLVWDRNGNGRIDDGSELFGNNTLLNNGSKAANGFTALADLDSNHDNKIDASDTAFTQLRLWKDADSNAVTSDGELLTLDAAGVGSIGLTYTTKAITDAQGNQHLQVGTYTQLDGTIRAMDDVWFAADTARTLDLDKIAVSDEIAALPELSGFGSVHSLHQAMARDTSGRLISLVNSLIDEDSLDAKRAIMTTLVYVWAGVEGIDPASRAATQIYGNVIGDARKLATLEAFLGEAYLGTWCWGTRDPNPHGAAAPILLKAFDQLVDHYFAQLLESNLFQELFKGIRLDWDLTTGKFKIDVSVALDELRADFANNPKDALTLMHYFGQNLHDKGDFGEEILAAFRQNGDLTGSIFDINLFGLGMNILVGDSEANTLVADANQENMILGFGGHDVLTSGNLGDTIIGGTGNDTLSGGAGNDTYLFAKGDGSDRINDYDTKNGNNDVAQFIDVGSADITDLQRVSSDLVVKYGNTDQLTVSNYFSSTSYRIEQFSFADGVSWDDAAIKARVMTMGTAGVDSITGYDDGANRIFGFDGNDYLYGGSKDDRIDGGDGNDTIYGGKGNDTLLGADGNDSLFGGDGDDLLDTGNGNDVMDGGIGNDSYLVHSGGIDRISDNGGSFDVVQLTDVASIDLQSIQRLGNDLVLKYGSADQLTVTNYFSSTSYRIEQFSFADGVSWDDAATKAKVKTMGTAGVDLITGYDDGTNRIFGFDGNDYLYGGSKDDRLDGGNGNDYLSGSAGNDILLSGDGNDTLLGGDGDDWLDSGNGVNVMDGGSGNDSYLVHSGSIDRITDSGGLDNVQFTDVASTKITAVDRRVNDLVLKYGSTDQLTVTNYFSSTYYRIEQFAFADGISWADTIIKAQVMTVGTAGADYIYGYDDGTNRIAGLDGNDIIYGGSKDDQLDGGISNDVLYGYGGNDRLLGGTGNDYLYAAAGADTLFGGDGDDALFGGDGDDQLNAGSGNDVMDGGSGNDSYLVHSGGIDRVSDSGGGFDVLQLADVASTDMQVVQRLRDDLIFNYGTNDQLILSNYFGSAFYRIEQLSFADDMSWDDAAIKARVMTTGTTGGDYIYGYDDAANRINGLDGNDSISGGSKDDLIDGGNGIDMLNGYGGNDSLFGGTDNDSLNGAAGNDILKGDDGDDTLAGGDGDDWLDGGSGNDVMNGGSGNDSYILRGAGIDRIYDSGGGLDNVQLIDVASTDITAVERRVNDLVLNYGSADQLTVTNYFSNAYYRIEQFGFANNVSWDDLTIKTRTATWGTAGADYLSGYDEAPNIMAGLDSNDSLYGGAKDDRLDGGNGNDNLYGNAGNDILQGKAGTDNLYDTTGNNLFDGGADNDTLTGGTGNELFIGGAGNDVINTGSGADIIAFNRGAGQETIQASMGTDNTISLGKGIAYDEVSLSKNGSDLILATGQSEQITLKNWYADSVYRSIANLQFVTEASLNYDAAATDPLLNQKIQQFNFENIVSHFDQAQSANVGLSRWAICSALLDAHLARSDLAGLGGDLTYGYGKNGNLSDMDIKSAQAVLGSSQFGSANQILLTANAVVDSSPRLI